MLGVTPRLAPDHPFARAVAPWPLEVPVAAEAGARVVAPAIVPVCVRVVSAAGGPAAGAEVGLFSLERGLSEPFAVPAATDSAGRLVLPASPGRYVVVALGRRAWARHAFEVAPSMEPIELRLEPIAQMRLRAVDVEGRPLAGVCVGSNGASSRSVRDPLQAVLLEISQSFHSRYFSGFKSDLEGRLVLSFIPSERRTVSFRLNSYTFGGPTLESSRLSLTETEEFEEVVLKAK